MLVIVLHKKMPGSIASDEMQAKKKSLMFRVSVVDAEAASIRFCCSSQPHPTTQPSQKIHSESQMGLSNPLFAAHSGDLIAPSDVRSQATCARTAFTEPTHEAASPAEDSVAARAMSPCTVGDAPCGTRAVNAVTSGMARVSNTAGSSPEKPYSAALVLCDDDSAQGSASMGDVEGALSSTDPGRLVVAIDRQMREAGRFLATVGGPEVLHHSRFD